MKKRMKWIFVGVLLSLLLIFVPAMATASDGTWIAENSGLASKYVYTLAIDPNNSQTIYAGGYGGVNKSTNGGGTWIAENTGLAGKYVVSFAIDPTNSKIIYAGTSSSGVIKSTDGGVTWSALLAGNGLPYVAASTNAKISSLAIDPTNSKIIYAGTSSNGVYKSSDGAGTWSPFNIGMGTTYVFSIVIDPNSSQTIYAGSGDGLFKSTDGGFSWITLQGSGVSPLAIDPTNSQIIYAGKSKSTDGGATWSSVSSGLPTSGIISLTIDPTNSQIIYAGTDYTGGTSSGVYKSTNGGDSWISINNGLDASVRVLAIDPSSSQTIYVGTDAGVYKWFVMPTISGTPSVSATAGNVYSFIPTATDATSFIISNKPSWASFDTTTGALTGTPVNANLGSYPNIVISANNGSLTVSLSAFTITVALPPIPTISGTPTTSIRAGSPYSFIPTATNASSFSISNKPAWASFNTTTGALTGTPANANLGSYPNIVISANNGSLMASLSAFAITVALPPIPTISGTPATSVTAGNTYSFTPTATNATSFSISNKPAWASFNTTTGALSGTPTNLNVGTNSNILISATNSTGTAILSAFAITTTTNITVPSAPSSISAIAGNSEATVSFSLPADIGGSAITGYTVKSNPAGGTDSNAGTTATSHAITGLTNGIAYTFTCTANNAAGTGPASAISNSVIPSSSNAPVLSISTLSNNSFTNNATLNITGTVKAANILKSLTINGTAVVVNLFGSFSAVVTLKQGANPLAIIAIDNVGKQTSDIRTINYDATMPVITIAAPADNSVTSKTFTDITGSVDDPNATVTAKINGGSSKSATMSGQNFSVSLNLISGLNTIDISATDQAGNSTSVKRTITTDSAVPTLAVTNPAQDVITTLGSITIGGTVTDAVTSAIIGITVDGQTYTPTVAANGSFSQTINLPTEKTYAVVVTATDQANNNATVQRNIIKTTALTQPTISDALKVLQAIVGINPLTATEQISYDVAPLSANGTPLGNGVIDAADVILILRRSIGIGSW